MTSSGDKITKCNHYLFFYFFTNIWSNDMYTNNKQQQQKC